MMRWRHAWHLPGVLLVTLAGGMAGCAAPDRPAWEYARESGGGDLPAACRRDLGGLDIPVHFVPRATLPQVPRRILGLWLGVGTRTILIDETLSGWRRAEVLHHERCHEWLFRTTGSPRWHS